MRVDRCCYLLEQELLVMFKPKHATIGAIAAGRITRHVVPLETEFSSWITRFH